MATEAVLITLQKLWGILRAQGIPAAVVGGVALALWKHARTTRDVDVLILADDADFGRLKDELLAAGFALKTDRSIDLDVTELWQFVFEPKDALVEVQVDLLRARSGFARQALQRSVDVGGETLGFDLTVLSCEDLVLLKLLAGRIIDRADAAALLRANATTIDDGQLDQRAKMLNLTDLLTEARRESRE